MRPNVVWFGESVDNASKAAAIIQTAELFVVIGTSLKVYPAADLLMYPRFDVPFYIIDLVLETFGLDEGFPYDV